MRRTRRVAIVATIAFVALFQGSFALNLRASEGSHKSYGVADAILSKFKESSRSLVEDALKGHKKPMAMMTPGADAGAANDKLMAETVSTKPDDPIASSDPMADAEAALAEIAKPETPAAKAPAPAAAVPAAAAPVAAAASAPAAAALVEEGPEAPVAPAAPAATPTGTMPPPMQQQQQKQFGGMPAWGMRPQMGQYPGMGMPYGGMPMGMPMMPRMPMGMPMMPRMGMPQPQMPAPAAEAAPDAPEDEPADEASAEEPEVATAASSSDSEFDSAISALENIIRSSESPSAPAAAAAAAPVAAAAAAPHHLKHHHHHMHHAAAAAPSAAAAPAPAMPLAAAAALPQMQAEAAAGLPQPAGALPQASGPQMGLEDLTPPESALGPPPALPSMPAAPAPAPAGPTMPGMPGGGAMAAPSGPADDGGAIKVNPYGIEPEYAAAIAQAHAQEQLQVQESVVASQMKRQHDLAVKKAENDKRVVNMLVNLTKRWESQANASQTMAEKAKELMMQITGAQVARAKLESAAQEEINAKRAHEINKATMKHHQEVLWALGNATKKSEDRADDASDALAKAFDLFKENSNKTGAAALAREGVDFAKLGIGKAMPAIPGAVPALLQPLEAAATAKLTPPPTAIALAKPDPSAAGGPVDPQAALKAVTNTLAQAQPQPQR